MSHRTIAAVVANMSAYCTFCGKGHPLALCPYTHGGSVARMHLRCTFCGSNAHSTEYCRKTAAGEGNRRRAPNGTFLD